MKRKGPCSLEESSDEEDENPGIDESCRDGTLPQHQEEPELPGIIENVTLVNFLCHSHLYVPFGPRVNFITGRNGSGKSAIMTGLVVALGGRASQTSRGLSVKNFVKKGCRSGQVSVQLRNSGSDAFKHSEYGDSIIIERRITADGGSSYKLKSREGYDNEYETMKNQNRSGLKDFEQKINLNHNININSHSFDHCSSIS